MSELNVNTITDASGGNTASINGATPTTDNTMGRNRIINGAMEIAQRGTSAVTASGSYPVDRFRISNVTDGAFSSQQDSSAPAGFVNSLKTTITTADASLSSGQYSAVNSTVEGLNLADLNWGTANAKTITVSFWVRSSLTGTFDGSIRNSAADRSYVFNYSISAADTWEYKTVTIPGDTSGVWLTTNGIGMRLWFSLGVGSSFHTTADAWQAGNYVGTSSGTSVFGTLNATWYITGVQLEAGSVATSFERRSYGQELALCQRYCRSFSAVPMGRIRDSDTVQGPGIYFGTTMRASPTLRSGATFTVNAGNNGTPAILTGTAAGSHPDITYIYSSAANWTTGALVSFTGIFEAEL